MMMSDHPQEVVQDHHGGPHVPVLCGLKGYRSDNHATSIVLTKDLNDDVKSAPRNCSGPP